MPVTNYHTLNGELLGETGPGGRRFYGKDALGSVVATYDQNGTLENTYRYKPYGGLLSKTGSAPDPRFMWTGSTGSRTTGANYAEQYNRARHYGSQQAALTAISQQWPTGHEYSYLGKGNPRRASPINTPYIEFPIPRLDFDVVHFSSLSNCGDARYDIRWRFPDYLTGWIVQEVVNADFSQGCGGPNFVVPNVYWEAWRIVKGRIYFGVLGPNALSSGTDMTHYLIHDFFGMWDTSCRHGERKKEGWAKFKADPLDSSFFPPGKVSFAGGLNATHVQPAQWTRAGAVYRFMKVRFACCQLCGPPQAGCDTFPNCSSGPYMCPQELECTRCG